MKKYFLLAGMMVWLLSCKNDSAKTAVQFSNEIIQMEESLSDPIFKTETQIKAYADSANYKGVAAAAAEMESIVQEKIDKIKTMNATRFIGGVDFKTMSIRYFEYIKNLYTTYKEIGNAQDEQGRVDASTKMNTILGAQPDVAQKMKDAQMKFSVDNGFPLRNLPNP